MEDNNDSMVRDWDFEINVSGVTAPSGRGKMPSGLYQTKITDVYAKPEKPSRLIIKMNVDGGEFTGAPCNAFMNRPTGEADDKSRPFWRALFESIGFSPKDLDSGSISVGPKSLVGRTAHVKYTAKDENNQYDNTQFLSPAAWLNAKQYSGEGTVVGEIKPATKLVTEPTKALGGSKTKGDVLKTLGVG